MYVVTFIVMLGADMASLIPSGNKIPLLKCSKVTFGIGKSKLFPSLPHTGDETILVLSLPVPVKGLSPEHHNRICPLGTCQVMVECKAG